MFTSPDISRIVTTVALAFLASLGTANSAWAQEPELDRLAFEISKRLENNNQKNQEKLRIAIFGFQRQDGKFTELGQQLTKDFVQVFAAHSPNVVLLEQREVEEALKKNGYAPAIQMEWWAAVGAAYDAGASIILFGTHSHAASKTRLTVSAMQMPEERMLTRVSKNLQLSSSQQLLDSKIILTSFPTSSSSAQSFPKPNEVGASTPLCVSCPAPTVTDEDLRQTGAWGLKVVLDVVVDTTGRVRNIRVVQGAGYDLTLSAIRAVRTWKLKPSQDGSGRPIAVQMAIEVAFRRI
ncbi:MAG TPA: TonB family protein [Candidatus Nitrosotenuis sp.]|nr:TonB family protein [Candidatus Nitrosotenuis sp.]